MISNFLLFLGLGIVLLGIIRIFLIYFQARHQIVEEYTGFDLAKEITSNYDEINIVESREGIYSVCFLKRNLIRLISGEYYSKDLFSLFVVSLLSGFSLLCADHNFYFEFFKKIWQKIRCFSWSFLVAIVISFITYTVMDAKIGVVLFLMVLMYQYFFLQIFQNSFSLVQLELEKMLSNDLDSKICLVFRAFDFGYRMFFVGSLVFLLREVVIILGI